MKNIFMFLMGCSVLILSGNVQAIEFYSPVELAPSGAFTIEGVDECVLQRKSSDSVFFSVCYVSKLNTDDNYGLRIVVTQESSNDANPDYISDGFNDIYKLDLGLFVSGSHTLLLAESSFEYIDGTDVFILKGNRLVYLGDIGFAAINPETGEDSSLIPQVLITRENDEYLVQFKSDVITTDGFGIAQTLSADEIQYSGQERLIPIRKL